jgi:MFS family permease
MSDIYSKKAMLFWGMFIQGIAIILLPLCLREPQAPGGLITNALHLIPFPYYLLPITYYLILLTSLLGFGTALVYPTFLSTIAQVTRPVDRAESIGVFRLWRDAGYAFGAIISGITADLFGLEYAIYLIGGITVLSAVVIQIRMPRILPTP